MAIRLPAAKETECVQTSSMGHGSSWRTTLWLVIGSVVAMLALQWWSSAHVLRSTAALRAVLSETHASANQFERSIGYGGLIHNFKNYVLRPNEAGYRVSALDDASEALVLLERLRTSAERIGIDATLTNTRRMLVSYTQRLESIPELAASGLSPQLIDEQVRFNDRPALQEVNTLLVSLSAAFDHRLGDLQRQGVVTSMMSTAGTAALGLLLIGIVTRWQRRQGVQHRQLSSVAESLTESNDDLAKLNTSLSQFAGLVSHDLKSPVRHIHTLNQMIVEDWDDASAVQQHVERIDQQVRQMDSIIDSLLEFTQFGFAEPQTEEVDVLSLFAEIENQLPSDTDQRGARVDFKFALDRPVLVDSRLMTRVFGNLISNSLKYTRDDEPARILVHAQSDGEWAVFSVSDNGIGIEARFAQKIFEPMTRLHGPQSAYKGVGIGLSLVKTIVESHGGSVWLDTEFTHGTRIAFSLPLAPPSELKKAA